MRWLVLCGVVRFSFWILAATAVLICTMSASAETVKFQFSGVVTDDSGNLGVFGPFGGVQVNDVFTGSFSYMTGPGNPDQEMGDLELGLYHVVDFVIDQAVVTITPLWVVVAHRQGTLILLPGSPDLGTDGFSVGGTFLAGEDTKLISLGLEAPYQAVFSDDSLPTSLTLSDFTDTSVVRSIRVVGLTPGAVSQIDEGQLTSLVLVPEPSTFVLAALGLLALLGFTRRRRK